MTPNWCQKLPATLGWLVWHFLQHHPWRALALLLQVSVSGIIFPGLTKNLGARFTLAHYCQNFACHLNLLLRFKISN
jgi:hypothetical protein